MRQESTGNHELAKWLTGIALGAIAMYLADPTQGRRRRALAQDKMRSMTHKTSGALNAAVHDASNRLSGLQAQASRIMGQGNKSKPIDNHVLEARVRSKLGRAMMNAHFIDVAADEGVVTLKGSVPPEDRQQVVKLVQGIPGVLDVRDKLHEHEQSGSLRSSRSGIYRMISEPREAFPPAWMLALLGGGILGYYGFTRRTSSGQLLAVAGLSYLARNLGYNELDRLLAGGNAGMIEVQKTIEIKASPETVFDIWTKYENFPHFMSHVVEVRDLGQERSHWIVSGPANARFEWDSVLTESSRPTALAWKSEPGAEIENSGSVYLEPYNGGTRATVQMSYWPPAGAVGKGVAALLGNDPEQELEDDLVRMKNFIESGVPPRETAQSAATQGKILH
ncbi:MAG: hypothetical protein A3I66_19245 [Burkholderiales bacterium RIFCSPLOWO2_02_FULL_57_36]|nr:MAG: hypothetical protein A3I66_19245 [Burkholderiales bacterium RIFCSPLOWO2_02_FULL_57_36]